MLDSYNFSLQASIDHDVFLCIVVIMLILPTATRKHFIAVMTK